MTDDQTVESTRVMGRVRSLLDEGGVNFAASFVNYPLCCPSRATLFTGQYAHNHGVLTGSGFKDLDSSNTLAVWLRDAGYTTAHVGKYVNGYGAQNQGGPTLVPPGWSEWYGVVPPDQAVYDYDLNENGTLVHYGSASEDFKGDVITRKSVDFVRRSAPSTAPFFLSVAYTAPHSAGPSEAPCANGAKPAPRHVGAFSAEPLPRPPSFNEADVSDKPQDIRAWPEVSDAAASRATVRYRCRLESLLHVDDGVGELAEALRAAGELDQTLIIFTSDNGFFQGEHRIQFGKIYPYTEAMQVPLLIRGPGLPSGRQVNALSTNADLAPTILDAAGVQPGRLQDGISLFDLVASPERERELLIESYLDDESYTPYTAVLTARYLYVEHSTGERELYDFSTDLFQLQSRHLDPLHAETRDWLARRLAQLRGCAGTGCQQAGGELRAPGTSIVRRPRRELDPPSRPVTVRFGFRATEPSTFECRLNTRGWRPCASPARYRVRMGDHRFRVRATDVAGDTDQTPAKWRWAVERR